MSSHHSQKFFDLHHQQVGAGRERRRSRSLGRFRSFLVSRNLIRAEVRRDYYICLGFSFLCFLYITFLTLSYLGYFARFGIDFY